VRIDPKLQLNIIFWSITTPTIPIAVLLVLICLVLSPITTRPADFTERIITKFAIWRNNLPIVKNAYDKVHLFDILKS